MEERRPLPLLITDYEVTYVHIFIALQLAILTLWIFGHHINSTQKGLTRSESGYNKS